MSVIVQDSSTNKIFLYCKGADSIITQLLSKSNKINDKDLKNLNDFSEEGLRTLLWAKKEIDSEYFKKWSIEYKNAKESLYERKKNIEMIGEKIETDLELVGVTGLEDKLQDGVSETVNSFRESGIKVWVLTGDKRETAINIGYACSFLNSNMKIISIKKSNYESCLYEFDMKVFKTDSVGLVVDGIYFD
jgi:magnesium-transporting ATPase (P-type)